MIQFTIKLTKEDVVKALRYYYRNQHSLRGVGLLIISGFFFALILTATILGNIPPIGYFFAAFLLLIFFIPIFVYVINPINLGKRVENDEIMSAPIDFTLSEDEIIITTTVETRTVRWDYFKQYMESDDMFLLLYAHSENGFQYIPKSIFNTEEEINNLRELFESHHLSTPVKSFSTKGIKQNKARLTILLFVLKMFGCIILGVIFLLITRNSMY